MEVIVSMGILGIFLMAIGLTLVEGYNAYTSSGQNVSNFREGTVAMGQMLKALRTCEKIYSPDILSDIYAPASFVPMESSAAPFIFVHIRPDTGIKEVMAYQWRDQSNEIVQFVYDPGFDLAYSYTQSVLPNTTKTLAGSVSNLSFQLEQTSTGEFLSVSFTTSQNRGRFPLSSTVLIRSSGY